MLRLVGNVTAFIAKLITVVLVQVISLDFAVGIRAPVMESVRRFVCPINLFAMEEHT